MYSTKGLTVLFFDNSNHQLLGFRGLTSWTRAHDMGHTLAVWSDNQSGEVPKSHPRINPEQLAFAKKQFMDGKAWLPLAYYTLFPHVSDFTNRWLSSPYIC